MRRLITNRNKFHFIDFKKSPCTKDTVTEIHLIGTFSSFHLVTYVNNLITCLNNFITGLVT
jgi:hypothetical protein